jgi:hypothetical protein
MEERGMGNFSMARPLPCLRDVGCLYSCEKDRQSFTGVKALVRNNVLSWHFEARPSTMLVLLSQDLHKRLSGLSVVPEADPANGSAPMSSASPLCLCMPLLDKRQVTKHDTSSPLRGERCNTLKCLHEFGCGARERGSQLKPDRGASACRRRRYPRLGSSSPLAMVRGGRAPTIRAMTALAQRGSASRVFPNHSRQPESSL